MHLVKLKDVNLSYFSTNGETPALENLSFNINKGDFVSIVGPSGCGKTTILSLISGLIKPTAGTVEIVNDEKTTAFVGYMFQKDNLLEWRTILQKRRQNYCNKIFYFFRKSTCILKKDVVI